MWEKYTLENLPLADQLRISGQIHVPFVISGIGPECGPLKIINPMDALARELLRYAFDPQAEFPE